MMSSNAPPIASVKMNEPATKATPMTIARPESRSLIFRAIRLRQVTLTIPQTPAVILAMISST